jgi:hypothetical protein
VASWLEFIATLVGILAWPVTIIAIILILRPRKPK